MFGYKRICKGMETSEMSRKKKSFQIPEQILRSINECSSGGFLLFTFNDQGIPETIANFDSPAHSIAMASFVKNWSNAIEEIHKNITIQNLCAANKR